MAPLHFDVRQSAYHARGLGQSSAAAQAAAATALLAAAALILTLLLSAGHARDVSSDQAGAGPSWLSLRVSEARGRVGPSLDHGVRYLYTRRNLPLRLVETSGEWRRVEDPLGARVWMHRRLLSARPSAMVRPQDDETRYAALRRAPEPDGAMAAWLEKDVIVLALEREGDFTRIQVRGLQGWVASSDLWGPIDNVERTQ